MIKTSGESICRLVVYAKMVLDLVVITHQPRKIHMLFQLLYDLSQEFLEIAVIGDDSETMAKQVLVSFLYRRRYRK